MRPLRSRSLFFLALLLAPCRTAVAQTEEIGSGELRGRVVSARTGQPLGGALVTLDSHALSTRTDSIGEFQLRGLPTGEHVLAIAAIGYLPARAMVTVRSASTVFLDAELESAPLALESVVTSAPPDAPRNIALPEFESRRALGSGRFLTRAELRRDRGRSLDAVLQARIPGLRVVTDRGARVAASGRTSGRVSSARQCYLNVFVDGVLRYQYIPGFPKEPFDLRSLEASMIAGIEIYNVASLPSEFNLGGNAACGALVIWLQN